MTLTEVREELQQLLVETRQVLYTAAPASGIVYVKLLRRVDALVLACKVVDTIAVLNLKLWPLRQPEKSCECTHSTEQHVASVGVCMKCNCKAWEQP